MVEMGDSDLPPAPVSGGSNVTASVCTVVMQACEQIRARLAAAAQAGPLKGRDPASMRLVDGTLRAADGTAEKLADVMGRASNGAIEVYAENIPHGLSPESLKMLYQGRPALGGGLEGKDRVMAAFGA